MSIVLGVHGVRTLPSFAVEDATPRLARDWTRFLNTSIVPQLSEDDVAVAYYAHLLRTADAEGQGPEDGLDYLGPASTAAVLAWARYLGVDAATGAQGRVYAPLRWTVNTIATRWGLDCRLAREFVARFFPEVTTYLHTPKVRTAVHELIAETITRHQPKVLLAHSLGSVIAYDTLWTHPELEINVLVTLGSPLGLPDVIFDHLHHTPRAGRGSRPPGVQTWVNLADPGDFIAVPPGLSNRFDGIATDLTTSTGAFAFHRVKGYLSHPVTAAALAPYLHADGRTIGDGLLP